ncbi:O-fucosyltransferase family protein [Enterococcus lactis]|uniref:Uncharacterized protein n=2 Tax=Bacillus thuringiensis TaxID=1428 RepID=A0A9X6LTW4_BACTU|nr:O-fucosyltransferase family protein [Bacillus thuringiensis]MEB9624647.1 O-fucosyltransferase family protein [Bacillus cereus]OTW55532.1 hypothetical protein BK699_00845 [Bacillus thuringiensis serovar mexicanensis]OUB55470.1 hypothetical protein BK741_00115 [Bacillus thuringiensis serovar iberica]
MYIQYEIKELEGLCNQLMAIFRTLEEAFFYKNKGEPVCIILNDVQSRTSIDCDVYPYFRNIEVDAFVDVKGLIQLLNDRNIEVKHVKDVKLLSQNKILNCRRFPNREVTLEESTDLGLFVAKFFPFSKRILKISNFIIGAMSFYPKWKAVHLRIERDLTHIPDINKTGLNIFIQNQFKNIIELVINNEDLCALYIASGLLENEYTALVDSLKEKKPDLKVINKKQLLKNYPDIQKEFNNLSLEEQALIDWLVCIGAPLFIGPHASSFSYLASYMRHYRGFNTEATYLFPEYQPYWNKWFPCV